MLSLYEYIAIDKVSQKIRSGECHIQPENVRPGQMFRHGETFYDIDPIVSIVQYYPASITLWPKSPKINYSWDFTGCAMGICRYNGQEYVCHIALDGNADSFGGYRNRHWEAVKQNITQIFFPYSGNTKNMYDQIYHKNNFDFTTCIGLIIGRNYYSMIFDKKAKRLVSIEKWNLINPNDHDMYDQNNRRKQLQYSQQFKLL